jgi:uncharacterized protein (TIGR03086 family)
VTTALAGVVELLDRALGYTRVVLADVTADHLSCPTPCRGWDLRDLLAHMDDALDAFGEAAGGRVTFPPPARDDLRVDRLQAKACALMGLWSGPPPHGVRIGNADLATEQLVAAAALEITVHGWDVGRVVSGGRPIPGQLADALLPLAHRLVSDADRGRRFAEPLSVEATAPAHVRLLAFLGRKA